MTISSQASLDVGGTLTIAGGGRITLSGGSLAVDMLDTSGGGDEGDEPDGVVTKEEFLASLQDSENPDRPDRPDRPDLPDRPNVPTP